MAFTYHEYKGLHWSCSDVISVPHLFTARLGGVGDYPYSSKPDPLWQSEEVQQRVRRLWLALCEGGGFPARLCFTRQVHGNVVRTVDESEATLPPLETLPEDCDGLCTARPALPLAVFTADCVPVLLCDEASGVVAALHCGWKGTAKDMIGAGVAALVKLGAAPERIGAAIGPAISACCFETGGEVPAAMTALLGADAQGTFQPKAGVEGKYMVDLKEVNRRRLLQLGVPSGNIDVSPDCTMCRSEQYWSHRATRGVRGTQASIIMLPEQRNER